jgi:nicotinate-nucleotide adenylyltransferase
VGVVLFGGAFDPPHLGHVAVADAARERFGVARLVVLVSERPAHRTVAASAEDRLALARAAFPADDVRLDSHPRTVDLLRAERFEDPVFVVGADQFRGFLGWSEPAEVLERARIAVATRPGFPRPELDAVLAQLDRPDRVVFFEIEPNPAASRDIRARAAGGKPLEGLVPDAVARLVAERELYRPRAADTLGEKRSEDTSRP